MCVSLFYMCVCVFAFRMFGYKRDEVVFLSGPLGSDETMIWRSVQEGPCVVLCEYFLIA